MVNSNTSETPAITAQQKLYSSDGKSALAAYKSMSVGKRSWGAFAGWELLQLLCSGLPGVFGLGLRSFSYPWVLGACGKRPAIGKGVVLRNPAAIEIGDKLLLDDYATLDARGDDVSICLESYVSIGRFSTVAAKGGKISLAEGVNVGTHCRLATQTSIEIGASVLIAAYCYIGPGNHQNSDDGTSLIESKMELKGGVRIGAHAWIGARCTILDGVTIGERAIVGAHSLVREDVPAGAIVAGTPARVIG